MQFNGTRCAWRGTRKKKTSFIYGILIDLLRTRLYLIIAITLNGRSCLLMVPTGFTNMRHSKRHTETCWIAVVHKQILILETEHLAYFNQISIFDYSRNMYALSVDYMRYDQKKLFADTSFVFNGINTSGMQHALCNNSIYQRIYCYCSVIH